VILGFTVTFLRGFEVESSIGRDQRVLALEIGQLCLGGFEPVAQPDDLLSYHFWAEDVAGNGERRRVWSDMYFAEVRPFEERYQEGPSGGESAGMDCPIVVDTEDVLLFGLGSSVVELIVTVFDVCVPAGVLSGALNVNWNVAVAPAANVAIVQTTGPVPLQLNVGPVVWLTETNVIPAGTVSVSVTLAAVDGPAFAAVTV